MWKYHAGNGEDCAYVHWADERGVEGFRFEEWWGRGEVEGDWFDTGWDAVERGAGEWGRLICCGWVWDLAVPGVDNLTV